MTATPSTGGGASQTWNTVNLAGSLSGTNLSGTTSAGSTPSGSMAFGGSSTGAFAGALFGPNAQEAGASWTLHDPSGQGKTAIGFFGAAR